MTNITPAFALSSIFDNRFGRGLRLFSALILLVTLFYTRGAYGEVETPRSGSVPGERQRQQDVKTVGQEHFDFAGNVSLSVEQLRSAAAMELHDFAASRYKRAAIDDAAFQMELLYRRSGFPFASVTYQYSDKSGNIRVMFQIDEGPAVVVRSLDLTGAQAIEKDTLLALFTAGGLHGAPHLPGLPYIKADWSGFVKNVKEFYLQKGFLDIQVQGPVITLSDDRTSADVAIHISEGLSYRLGRVRFSGGDLSAVDSQLETMVQQYRGKVYFPRMKVTLKNSITAIMADAGFAGAQVQVTAEKRDGIVDIEAVIHPGPKVTITKIVITGNERTRERFIRTRLSLHPGELYSLRAKQESFNTLYRTGLFSSVSMVLAGDEGEARRPLEIRVTELPAREVYFEPGWGSYELARFEAGYLDKNIFGSGRSLRLDGGASFKGRNLLLGFTDPWLLGNDIALDLPLYYSYRQEPSYTEEKTGVNVQLNRKIDLYSTISLGYFYDSSHLFDIKEEAAPTATDSDYVTAGGRMQFNRDTRNDIFYPSRGYYGNIRFELSDPTLASELSYTRFLAGISSFFSLPGEFVVGLRWKTGFVLPLTRNNTIPLGERLFNGGENTVRSFTQSNLGPLNAAGDPVGGTAYNVFNIELRKKLGNRLAATLFMDAGNVVPSNGDEEILNADRATQWQKTFGSYFSEIRSGIGFGLQYLLPVGPLRLDIAFNPDKRPGEDAYAVHFSIGMAF